MKKNSKSIQKRFDNIPWDTKDYLIKPLSVTFSWVKWYFISGNTEYIQDFFLSPEDKYPFCSLYLDSQRLGRGLLSFGFGKRAIFKQLRSIETHWSKKNAKESLEAASIGLQIPIDDEIILNIQ
jgi:hypothetical protein